MYGLQLKAGRFFTAAIPVQFLNSLPEGQRFPKSVVNEKLIQELGFASAEAALGKTILDRVGWMACRNSRRSSGFQYQFIA